MKTALVPVFVFTVVTTASPSEAAWLWNPDIGKWFNIKKTTKDTPEAQFEWARRFYDEKNWDRAIEEFEKIPEFFPHSRLAAEAVYYVGLSWEGKDDLAKAADAFQKLIDRYPYSDRIKDAIQREYDIAWKFASGAKMKLLGIPVLAGQDKALELYKHVVKNAPFGVYGAEAQFKIGEVYKMQGEYQEAQKAFQAVVDEYPQSEPVAQARYQIAYCSMQASKKSQYNEQYAQRAIEEFQGFKNNFPGDQQVTEADEAIKALRTKKAMTQFEVASFYQRQGKLSSAKVYYREVVQKYPDTSVAGEAEARLNEIIGSENKPPASKSKFPFKLW